MKSMISKIILIVVIAVNIGTLSLFTIVPAESFSLTKIGSPNTEGEVIGPPKLTLISSSNTGIPGPSGPANDTGIPGPSGPANDTGIPGPSGPANDTGIPGPSGPANANKALIDIYNTIILQQQDLIQFLLEQQKTLRDLLINSSSSYGDSS
jgi:hypothetical protein